MQSSKLKEFFEKPFRITILFFISGLVFLILIPAGQTPDESNHFFRSYEISELKFEYTTLKDGQEAQITSFNACWDTQVVCKGVMLPRSLAKSFELTEQDFVYGFEKRAFNFEKYNQSWKVLLNKDDQIFYVGRQTSTYSPIPYLPQALAISILKPLNPPVILLVYFAKLFVLSFSSICLFISLKIMKKAFTELSIFFTISLLPMVLHQSVSLSADVVQFWPVLIAISLLARNAFIKGSENASSNVLSSKVRAFFENNLLFLSAGLCLLVSLFSKPTTLALFLLLFLDKSKRKLAGLFTLFSILIYELYSHFLQNQTVPEFAPYQGLGYDKINLIKSMPQGILGVIGNFFREFWGGFFSGENIRILVSVFARFGQNSIILPYIITFAFIVYICCLTISFAKKNNFAFIPFRVSFFIVFAYFFLTLFVIYLINCPLNNWDIIGFQGRYMLPALILLFFTKPVQLVKKDSFRSRVWVKIDSFSDSVVNRINPVLVSVLYFILSAIVIYLFYFHHIYIKA